MSADLWGELADRRDRIDAALRDALAAHAADAPPALAEAMSYSLMGPGKRLRPLLVVLACEAAGGGLDAALPGAVAVEMVHTYSLVHDDLPAMDDDDLRRGRPTCHVKFGEALAILTGDALLTLAFGVIAEGCSPPVAAVSCAELARGAGAVGMVGGQVLDLEAEGRIGASGGREPPDSQTESGGSRPPLAKLEGIHRRKTGALFRSALRLGVYAAGSAPTALAAADEYAGAFGLLFQVTDDLLDAEGSATAAGKRVGKDAARGKLTYPGLLGVGESRRRAADLARQAVAAAGKLGSRPLADLARYVVERDR